MKLIWLLLVPGPQPTEASNCLFDRVEEVVKHESRPAIHMEKQLGWAHKLGGMKPLGVSRVGLSQVDGISDMAPACWLCGFVGGVFRKRTMASDCLSV